MPIVNLQKELSKLTPEAQGRVIEKWLDRQLELLEEIEHEERREA